MPPHEVAVVPVAAASTSATVPLCNPRNLGAARWLKQRFRAAPTVLDFFTLAESCAVVGVVPFREGWSSFSAVAARIRELPHLVIHNTQQSGGAFRYEILAEVAGGERILNTFYATERSDLSEELHRFASTVWRRCS